MRPCPWCGGSGIGIRSYRCWLCRGTGRRPDLPDSSATESDAPASPLAPPPADPYFSASAAEDRRAWEQGMP